MSDKIEIQGQCLCGAIQVTAKQVAKSIGACHCSMCTNWTGGPLLTIDCGTEVSFKGEVNIAVFNSSEWAERGFCKQCGSHLFYLLKETKQYFIPAGLFNKLEEFTLDHQVFIDEKPNYYTFANQTKNMTGAEVFAMYAPGTE